VKNSFPKDTSKYKLIVSDFDGTLAGPAHSTSQGVKEAVKRWIDKGYFFTIATGRSFYMLDDECMKLGLTTPVVVRGGAEVVDPKSGKAIHREFINKEDVSSILRLIQEDDQFYLAIEEENIIYVNFELIGIFPKLIYKNPSEFNIKSIPKIHIIPKTKDSRSAEAFIREMVRKLPKVHAIATHNQKFGLGWDITSVKATKLHGIVKVMEILGLRRNEIVGVGDSYNDFPLLEAAGLKVAMGNAHQELKEIADVIVPSYEDDGVAYLIDKLLE
jgi:Cof subfamily protein (haloacid dehalogenase superfamily)